MESYRSGHNGAVLKTVRAKAHRGSNPLPSANVHGNSTGIAVLFIAALTPCLTSYLIPGGK